MFMSLGFGLISFFPDDNTSRNFVRSDAWKKNNINMSLRLRDINKKNILLYITEGEIYYRANNGPIS